MSNKDWTSKLRDQMTDYQEPVKHDLWAGIAQSLAQNQPVAGENRVPENHPVKRVEKEPKARVVTLKRWSAAAAAVVLLGIGGSYVYLHQEDVEQGNAQLASLVSSSSSSSSSHASASVQSNITAKTGGVLKNASLLAADFKSADYSSNAGYKSADSNFKKSQEAASSARSLYSSDNASVSAQSAAPMNDEGETLNVVASDAAPLLAAEYKSAESAKRQVEPRKDYAEPTSSSLGFSRNSEVAGVSMKLYAENFGAGMGNVNSGSNIVNRYSDSGVMADPMPGVYPDPSVGGSNDVDYLMAAAYKALQKSPQGKAKHHAPVSVGMQIAFGVAPRLSLSTGVVYTRTSSDFYPYAPNNDYNVHQVLHYVGIPVGLNYELWRSGGFHAYVMAGAEAAYNVKNDTDEDGTRKQDAKRDRVQFSGKASLGAQYDISPSVGLYIEPGAKYYFDNGSDIENTFKDKKLNFNLQFGLRFNL
ncbi:outer membrane beta-barrel protein [Segatella copri]|uniref:outer membrane beta-barrel protein n=1 Tax=Segatella copri TaxID=165179 RepID=UPI003F70653C